MQKQNLKISIVAMEMRKFSHREPIGLMVLNFCMKGLCGHKNLHTKTGKIYVTVLKIVPIAMAWQPELDRGSGAL